MEVTPCQLRAARALLGWSQRELAERAVMARATVAEAERDGGRISRMMLQALVDTLQKEGITFVSASGAACVCLRAPTT
ncbi:helix-turn-helix domain-containing protein [Falsiroseomonas oryzae]|uniref:helix-turn-helix domain-containing protein n=1 Tax=Falsiroseomonas oryzae TaxID=2766473 RepID=UPI0022EAFE81|nr:helix-turn-helix transcriptional regulator [Roseomonas sp. MO-31]